MSENNKNVDELLELLGNEISEMRFREMNQEYEKRNTLHVKKKKNRYKSIMKVSVIVICAFIGIMAVTTATSDAFRTKLFGFIFEKQEGYVNLVPSKQKHVMYPTYMLSGYEKTSEEHFGTAQIIIYENDNKKDCITISEKFGEDFQESADNETTEYEKCYVGIYEGYFFSSDQESGNNLYTLVWQNDEVLIEITSTIGKKEMIKIGQSLK